MRKAAILVFALLLGTLASTAMAQIDVEMAFDPAEAHPGDTVFFFFSIANLGDEAVDAELAITFAWDEWEFGPFGGMLPLAAGEELSTEFDFMIPPFPFGGTLTITVTATAGDYSDTATASLTIIADEFASEEDQEQLNQTFTEFADRLTDDGEENEPAVLNISAVKALY